MYAQAQPDVMPFLKMRLDGVLCLEPGLSSNNVVEAGTPIQLRTELGFEGSFVGLLTGDTFSIVNHIENIETGAKKNLSGGAFAVPAPGAASHISVLSPAYTTGGPGSGADFEIPAGFSAGTYRILTHVHAASSAIAPIVAGFCDGLIVMVT